MDKGEKKIKVIYSSTNEKELKEVISALIYVHEQNTHEEGVKNAVNR